jgi:hypothetical protein
VFSPEGSWHERFDQFGRYHASADGQVDPEDLDLADEEYTAFLRSRTEAGGLNTWLIEEVEWSGRVDDTSPRTLGNREDNTVHLPRWERWIQLLEFVRDYPGGVVMTQGDVALAKAFDNAPTLANPDHADADHDGIGDVIDGATLTPTSTAVQRSVPSLLTATLTNGAGAPVAGQAVAFAFDADGDGVDERYAGTSGADGVASASVTTSRPVGPATFTMAWDGVRTSASPEGTVEVPDAATLMMADVVSPRPEPAVAVATLTDSDGAAIEGRAVSLYVETKVRSDPAWVFVGEALTDGAGQVGIVVPNHCISQQPRPILAVFTGDGNYSSADAVAVVVRA